MPKTASHTLVCIKVGGSLVTDKATPFTANTAAIKLFAAEFHAVWTRYSSTTHFLLGNGVGSYGHFTAHEYGLREGAHNDQQRIGVGLTHQSVRDLNNMITKELIDAGVPAYALSPGDLFSASDGNITGSNITLVRTLLEQGYAPLLHGDTIIDSARGVTIYSTERSLFWCGSQLRDAYSTVLVIELLNTGGVLDENGTVLDSLTPEQPIPILNRHTHDVTGGIEGKIHSAREATAWADSVRLIGLEPGTLQRALSGERVGTEIK